MRGTFVCASFTLCLLVSATSADAHPHHAHALAKQTASQVDYDGSGVVDFLDFVAFASAFGQPGTGDNAKFDLDGSGSVDFNDFVAFSGLFGQIATPDDNSGSDGGTNTFGNVTTITVEGNQRVIRSNGLPSHETGEFPNSGNPHAIAEQDLVFRVPLNPAAAASTTSLLGTDNRPAYKFGVAVNGLPFDPVTAEFFMRDASTGWNIEAIGTLNLGLDQNEAHVQPNGLYHYHGVPYGLFGSQTDTGHSELYGYAADGYPVYINYGHTDPGDTGSAIKKLTSSYRLKSGNRPQGQGNPPGAYDGTYTQDYEYVDGLGDLDECNGRTGVTPEYANGTYMYFITETYPFQPRCFRGTPNQTFKLGPP